MKKRLTLGFLLILALSLLTACSGGNSDNSNTSSNDNTNANTSTIDSSNSTSQAESGNSGNSTSTSPPVMPAREVEIPNEPLDLSDDNIYFVEIEGVKYNLLETTVGDLINDGFTLDEDENMQVEHGQGGTRYDGGMFMYTRSNKMIYLNPINLTGNTILLKDCRIDAIFLEGIGLEVYIVCNLSFGSTRDNVISVFGDREDFMYHEGPGMFEGRGIYIGFDDSGINKFSFVSLQQR